LNISSSRAGSILGRALSSAKISDRLAIFPQASSPIMKG
jgi:hypothetical protein